MTLYGNSCEKKKAIHVKNNTVTVNLIADSGSTKTTWMDVASGNKVVTEGLNPHLTSDEVFLAACATVRQQFTTHDSQFTIHFYGAGCGSDSQRERVKRLLQQGFATHDVEVETDLLAACRATWGHHEGLVGILGTGSNACHYDGSRITGQAPSLGWILGDHGSANHVGRLLLLDYLTGKIPDELDTLFHDAYPLSHADWIDLLYHQSNPNRKLASLAPFAVAHLDDDYCRNTLYYALDDWYSYQLADLVLQTNCHRICVVGGFAAAIRALLSDYCSDNSLTLATVLSDPIDALRRYHA